MNGYWEIIRRNLFSPIVIALFLLAGALIYAREYRDAWFISVVIVVNSLIGIVQEIRAKRALKKLELMSQPRARLLSADGSVTEVAYDSLRVGDKIQLIAGDEVPADVEMLEVKGLELNESMLTGESAAVGKNVGGMGWGAATGRPSGAPRPGGACRRPGGEPVRRGTTPPGPGDGDPRASRTVVHG